MFKPLTSITADSHDVVNCLYQDNQLVIFDKSKIDIVMNTNEYTHLTKNVWRMDPGNQMLYTLNRNNSKFYLVELLTNTKRQRFTYSFNSKDNFDYRCSNIHMVDDLKRFISKKISKKYYILQYIGGHVPKAGKDTGKLKNPIWIVRFKSPTLPTDNDPFCIMYCEKDKLTLFSLEMMDKIKHHTWFFLTNGYIGSQIIHNKKNTMRYLHQHITNHFGHGKGQASVDHINRCKLDNRTHNLRIVSQSIQNQNCGKRRRNKTAQPLPSVLEGITLPKYVYYATDVVKTKSKGSYTREYFRIEKHPNLTKKCISSSKSTNKSILEKLEDIKQKLHYLDHPEDIQPQKEDPNKLPPYISLKSFTNGKHTLIYDRRVEGNCFNLKYTFKGDVKEHLPLFQTKINTKYPDSQNFC